jgi:flagellar biosynthetic protein FliP
MNQAAATLSSTGAGSKRAFTRHFGEMLLAMFAGMVAWMSHRGHDAARSAEMAASMIVPSLFAAILAWAGTLGAAGALAVQHGVMIPAMLAVTLWRYADYSHAHPRAA